MSNQTSIELQSSELRSEGETDQSSYGAEIFSVASLDIGVGTIHRSQRKSSLVLTARLFWTTRKFKTLSRITDKLEHQQSWCFRQGKMSCFEKTELTRNLHCLSL